MIKGKIILIQALRFLIGTLGSNEKNETEISIALGVQLFNTMLPLQQNDPKAEELLQIFENDQRQLFASWHGREGHRSIAVKWSYRIKQLLRHFSNSGGCHKRETSSNVTNLEPRGRIT